MSDSGDVTNVDDHAKENCDLTAIDKRKHSSSPSEPEAKKTKVEEIEISDDDEPCGQKKPASISATTTPTRRTRTPRVITPRIVVDTEAEKLRKAEEKRKKDEERETARTVAEEKRRLKEEQKENERRQKEEQKENERRQKEEQKENERRQREEQKENERREREKQKEEKRLKKEQEEREKEEKRKQKLEEEERKKEEKNEKKRQEEEERLKKKKEKDDKREAERREEEEKKEQKRKDEEASEEKKRRESSRFLGFFKPIERPKGAQASDDINLWYKPFERKPGMVVAPEIRRSAIPIGVDILNTPVGDVSYLKSPKVVNRKLVGSKNLELKAKLFQFHENYRPAYYGTWRKRDKSVSFKRPWLKASEGNIDYEVESDDDWEDEPSDAEECKSDEEDPDDGEESDGDGWMVEPDYLSDGEGSDEEGVRDGEAPEARAKRLAGRAREWSENVKRKTETKIKNPVCIGPIFGSTPICEKLDGCIAVIL